MYFVTLCVSSPVLLLLGAQCESVVLGMGLVSFPVPQLYSHGVLALTGQQVQSFITQPVLS